MTKPKANNFPNRRQLNQLGSIWWRQHPNSKHAKQHIKQTCGCWERSFAQGAFSAFFFAVFDFSAFATPSPEQPNHMRKRHNLFFCKREHATMLTCGSRCYQTFNFWIHVGIRTTLHRRHTGCSNWPFRIIISLRIRSSQFRLSRFRSRILIFNRHFTRRRRTCRFCRRRCRLGFSKTKKNSKSTKRKTRNSKSKTQIQIQVWELYPPPRAKSTIPKEIITNRWKLKQ